LDPNPEWKACNAQLLQDPSKQRCCVNPTNPWPMIKKCGNAAIVVNAAMRAFCF
jgi:hypothetical protein